MLAALKNRPRPMGKQPKSGTHATRMQHKKYPLCNTIPAPQDSQHTLSPRYPMYTILSSLRQTARIRAKKRLGYALFRLLSTNLIGNFLVKYPLLKLFPLFSVQTHHMYFPGRILFRLFYYFNSLFSLRKTEYEKPRDIIRPGSVLISHSTIGIGHIITVDHQVSPFSASAPLNRYRRGHYSAVRTKSQWLRISQCLK